MARVNDLLLSHFLALADNIRGRVRGLKVIGFRGRFQTCPIRSLVPVFDRDDGGANGVEVRILAEKETFKEKEYL